ncbi:MAG TPA: imidazole glycerol phosphate synthase subunit HisH, partial [Clostridia bacterium]
MIAVVDYGVGNLFSLMSSLRFLGLDCIVTNKKEDLTGADRIILPGVGAFGDAMAKLRESGLENTVKE